LIAALAKSKTRTAVKREAEEDWGRGKGNSGIDSDTRNEARQIAVVVAAPVRSFPPP